MPYSRRKRKNYLACFKKEETTLRIQAIELSWFRGAGARVSLRPLSKNLIVYGANGSGKSSFVDAIEYILAGERIEHLAHEYSGHKQVVAVRNTHTPNGVPSKIRLEFDNHSVIETEISPEGGVTYTESPQGLLKGIRNWDLMRTVLRQDKVADFIHATKGQKYSEVLPLLGLQNFETSAENLRKLRTEIDEQAKTPFIESTLEKSVEAGRRSWEL